MKSIILYVLLTLVFAAAAVWLCFVPGGCPVWISRAVVFTGAFGALGLAVDAWWEYKLRREMQKRSRAWKRAAAVDEEISRAGMRLRRLREVRPESEQ